MKILENKKIIIFDFDHTIGHLDIEWNIVRNELHEFYMKRYKTNISFRSVSVGINKAYRKFGKEGKEASFNILYKHELAKIENFKFIEPVKNFIEKNRKNYILAICSGNFTKTIGKALGKITKYFKLIVGRETVGLLKPEPEGLKLILRKLKAKKEDCIFIGDGMEDKKAAEKAKIDFIFIDEFIKEIQI